MHGAREGGAVKDSDRHGLGYVLHPKTRLHFRLNSKHLALQNSFPFGVVTSQPARAGCIPCRCVSRLIKEALHHGGPSRTPPGSRTRVCQGETGFKALNPRATHWRPFIHAIQGLRALQKRETTNNAGAWGRGGKMDFQRPASAGSSPTSSCHFFMQVKTGMLRRAGSSPWA